MHPEHQVETAVSEATTPQAAPPGDEVRTAERRSCGRYHYRRQPIVRFLVRPNFQPGRGFLRDLSRHGLALLLTRPLDPGTVLFVQLRGGRRGVTHTQLARVVHAAEQSPGRWLVGCELTCPLSDAQLQVYQSENWC